MTRDFGDWLPCLTLTEAVLLYYKKDVEQNDLSSQQKRDHILRLGHYAVKGEPVMPNPEQDHLPDADIQRYLTSLLDKKQPMAFEFWLSCREVTSSNLFQFWEIKT
jgi:hypothetical protein